MPDVLFDVLSGQARTGCTARSSSRPFGICVLSNSNNILSSSELLNRPGKILLGESLSLRMFQ
jgi:hypothetical protein